MYKVLSIIFACIVTSLYFFPIVFSFLPGVNTKMALAAFGLVLLWKNLAQSRDSLVNNDFIVLSLWGLFVSLIGFVSVTVNETPDYTYVTYFMSMWVWLGGGYAVTRLIKSVHGNISMRLVIHYLIVVCVAQCIIAFIMDQSVPVKSFVDNFLASEGFMGKVEGRMYGIGASLDVAGMRFAAVLIMIAYLCMNNEKPYSLIRVIFYIFSFFIIVVIGNMIGRTTTVGAVVALIYMMYVSINANEEQRNDYKSIWTVFAVILSIMLPIIVYKYHSDVAIQENIRFAFEGFFSLWEHGTWELTSNEILKTMYVFPDNIKTWIIGDGYFNNPSVDPYYIGPKYAGFYHDTDAGYLRFIYYFGVVGLFAFILYMYKAASICVVRFKQYKLLIWLILLLNYIVWFKVASDLFLIFSLFLCISYEEQGDLIYDKR